ncbi:hypothetical protein SAMN04487965_0956 [Microbulbifer donghaiensis]|uniref:Uncharacterized protein n=1 Tax=Microbulbifer donghaiensis TaxID=494016 RepID=A0A1M4XFQ9_9GAMM|nr:hypothetical protein [Microbulbifer donghaiensis]SHE92308.1 hypothetical protein SAMN04487965_0956 [Microbulbifer donghaiensis]
MTQASTERRYDIDWLQRLMILTAAGCFAGDAAIWRLNLCDMSAARGEKRATGPVLSQ